MGHNSRVRMRSESLHVGGVPIPRRTAATAGEVYRCRICITHDTRFERIGGLIESSFGGLATLVPSRNDKLLLRSDVFPSHTP